MSYKPASLAQLFEPPTQPEQHRGVFGWLCGYAADAGFLENALERFSALTHAQRAYQGRLLLAVMLDPGSPQIAPAEAPGALHLPVKVARLPFALLHAKVAVLGFQSADRFVLRVIVSTGNWTRQTLDESLDLAWHVDVLSHNEDADVEVTRQDCTDLAAAWDFLTAVQQFFDLRLLELPAGRTNETAHQAAKFAAWIEQIAKRHRGYRPRFFDTRTHSLFAQLPNLVRHHATGVARNYSALGSGFFEGEGSGGTFVPERILEALREHKLVTATCIKDLFVNPLACQAVAAHQSWIEKRGWTIRAASAPAYFGAAARALHAKFIFSANFRDRANNCSSAWVYLGSANLTNPGFMNKASLTGNLEAGVIFVPEALRWHAKGKKDDGADVVTNLLPIHWNDDISLPALQAGQDMPERDAAFVAAPVALFLWEERSEGPGLAPQGEVLGAFELLDPDGHPCGRRADGSFTWPGKRPRQVTVAWPVDGVMRRASVPVIDGYGRYCAADLPVLDLEEAWIQLANFPMPPEDEELTDGDSADAIDGVLADGVVRATPSSIYPVRRMMILVEDIAAKQAAIAEADWAMWCNRLEQVLTQAKNSTVVKAFQAIALNPLHPLFAPALRPAFAATVQTEQGVRYEAALNAAITAWQLENCPKLGDLR